MNERQRIKPQIVNAPQRSEEWFLARLGNVTGSQVTKTMEYRAVTKGQMAEALAIHIDQGIDPDYCEEMMEKYPAEFCLEVGIDLFESAARLNYRRDIVAERITGMRSDSDPYVTADMQWGVLNEITAVTLYQMRYQKIVDPAPLMLHPKLLCGASPDGLVVDKETGELGCAEVKCLRSANHLYKVIKTDEMPSEYIPQVQMQMWISGRDWCDFIAYDSRVKEGLEMFVKRIPYDDFYVDNVLVPSIVRFLQECDHDEIVFMAIMKQRNEETKKRQLELAERLKVNG